MAVLLRKQIVPGLEDISRVREHPSGMRVELLDWMGNDIDIVNAARTSLGKKSEYDWWIDLPLHESPLPYEHEFVQFILSEWNSTKPRPQPYPLLKVKDDGLIRFLMEQRHGTPFEAVVLKFHVRAPIGVVWEWVRHRIASYSVMSTRYLDWDNDYYIPQAEDWRTQVGKVGHYRFEPMDLDKTVLAQELYERAMTQAFEYYGLLIETGLAREVARNVLPMGAMTEFVWTINVRSLLNFLSLRNEEHALREMRFCAAMVEDLTGLIVPVTLEKWNARERVAP